MNEPKGKWVYLVASTVVTGVIGYFLPKALDAMLPWLSENPLSQYPLETVGIAVAASLTGFFAGNRFEKSRNQKSKKPTQEEMEAENETIEAFKKICGTCYLDEEGNIVEPLIFSLDDAELKTIDLSRRGILLAKEAALIEVKDIGGIGSANKARKGLIPGISFAQDDRYNDCTSLLIRFSIGNKLVRTPTLEKNGLPDECIDLGKVRFTIKGKELAETIQPYRQERMLEYVDKRYYDTLGSLRPSNP